MNPRTPERAAQILELISTTTMPRHEVAKAVGISLGCLQLWLSQDKEFYAAYLLAKEDQAELIVDEIMQISDDGSNDSYVDEHGNRRTDQDVLGRSKLRVDSRKWLAARLAPKRYGDKQIVDMNVKNDPTIEEVNAQLAQLAAKVSK
jgi:hypothetical protein